MTTVMAESATPSSTTSFNKVDIYYWILHSDPNLFAKLDRNRDGGLICRKYLRSTISSKQGTSPAKAAEHTFVACILRALSALMEEQLIIIIIISIQHMTCVLLAMHSYFLDNHVLLRSKRGPPHAPPNLAMAVAEQNPLVNITNNYYVNQAAPQIQRNRWYQAFQTLETALSISALASNCTIM
ncbi:Calcium-binding EF-hand family protein [Prunus dulcis]|uniref:Calcium-binding EF-hand family protein n=1 Tax=Prunus dulcis TaxID=3755 RepID=A0A4Y1QL67_PRUDU|nr:Calcium-binding EF-hand family protein [Prunus dulcis]